MDLLLRKEIREKLRSLAHEKTRLFVERIVPGVGKIWGVSTPDLNRLAKEIRKSDWKTFLDHPYADPYYEEVMLQVMVLGEAPLSFDETLTYLEKILPQITNWAHCDTLCSRLKITKKHLDEMENFLQTCRNRGPWYTRFVVVMLLNYYLDDAHIDTVLQVLHETRSSEYYVRMAVAWAVSVAFVKFPEKTMQVLLQNPDGLDTATHNLALRKIRESRKVPAETKKEIQSLKR